MYLLDNNVLSHLSRAQRASDFFLTRCRLPTEVIHEAIGYPDATTFGRVEYPTTADVLRHLRNVMVSVAVGDTALVNLYANKGAADPMLIACALDGMENRTEYLFGDTWVVVSNDKAVRAKATQLSVESLSRQEFFQATQHRWGA